MSCTTVVPVTVIGPACDKWALHVSKCQYDVIMSVWCTWGSVNEQHHTVFVVGAPCMLLLVPHTLRLSSYYCSPATINNHNQQLDHQSQDCTAQISCSV